MTQPNNTAQLLQKLFNDAHTPYYCVEVTSIHDTDFSTVAIYNRIEMPDKEAIMETDLSDIQAIHLKQSFEDIGLEMLEAETTADFEVIKDRDFACAILVASPKNEATVATREGLMFLGSDNDSESYCVGLHVNKNFLRFKGDKLKEALTRHAPKALKPSKA